MIVFRVLGRLLGRFFGGIGKIFLGFFRWVARHELALGLIVIAGLIVGGIWLLLSVLNINIVVGEPQAVPGKPVPTAPPAPTAAPTPTPVPQVTKSNAPAAAEAFIQGYVYFNADQVWNTLDPQLHNQLQQIGRDKSYFERQFNDAKQRGVQYQGYNYIGGYDPGNGESTIHFYVVRFIDSDNKPKSTPYTIIIDKQGKIIAFD